jgi:hypothetical protein
MLGPNVGSWLMLGEVKGGGTAVGGALGWPALGAEDLTAEGAWLAEAMEAELGCKLGKTLGTPLGIELEVRPGLAVGIRGIEVGSSLWGLLLGKLVGIALGD